MSKSRVRLKKNVAPTGLRPHQWAKLLEIKPDCYVHIWRDPTINKITVSALKEHQPYFESHGAYIRTESDDFDENQLYFIMELPE